MSKAYETMTNEELLQEKSRLEEIATVNSIKEKALKIAANSAYFSCALA